MIKQGTIAFYSLIFLVLVAQSCSKSSSSENKGKNTKGVSGMYVDATIVKQSPLELSLLVPGSIRPNEQVELKAESSGKLVELNLAEGTFVKKGDLLARINDSEIRAMLQKKMLEEKLASDDESRKKRLLEIDAISIQDYEASQNNLEGIRADIAQTKAQLAKAEVRAPFDGKIGLRYVSLGAYISPNTVLATLVQENPLKVEFSVPERYSSYVKPGLEIKFTVGDSPKEYDAKVYAVESAIDPDTRSLKARAMYPNTTEKIIPGTFAKVNIVFQDLPQAITISPQAIVPEMDKQTVFVAKNGKVSKKMVTIGERTGNAVEILNGVSVGDTLILTGLTSLRDGMPINVNIQE